EKIAREAGIAQGNQVNLLLIQGASLLVDLLGRRDPTQLIELTRAETMPPLKFFVGGMEDFTRRGDTLDKASENGAIKAAVDERQPVDDFLRGCAPHSNEAR